LAEDPTSGLPGRMEGGGYKNNSLAMK